MTMQYMQIKKARNRFAGITIFTFIFSVIYEYFSHGVYSGFMICAAFIPLVGVVLPYTIWLRRAARRAARKDQEDYRNYTDRDEQETLAGVADSIYRSAVSTFLLGSIFMGILEIYGTTNRLSKVYWIVGGVLLAVSLGMMCKRMMCTERLA